MFPRAVLVTANHRVDFRHKKKAQMSKTSQKYNDVYKLAQAHKNST